ncbi:MAG: zinc-binding dehydrogenase [Candidatus Dormibacterales bacterium]
MLQLREDWPSPVPGPDQVSIKVTSAGVNFADVNAVRGTYPSPPPPFIPGLEVAGIERETGRPVVAQVPFGGFAEEAVAPRSLVFDAGRLDLLEAGGYALVTLTCFLALAHVARLQKGESLLVLAAAGGVGSTAIQVARALGAGTIVGVASTPEKGAHALAQGADVALGYEDDFPAADVVLDGVGGDAFLKAYHATGVFGRMILLGASSGRPPELPDFRTLRDKSVAVMPFSFGALRRERPDLTAKLAPEGFRLLHEGLVKPPVGRRYPLAEGGAALRALAARETVGKLVLVP